MVMETTTNTQKIEKALEILKYQDWFWAMADYTHPAIDEARGSMRAFVNVVASISDRAIVKALRELWKATYEYVHATMWGSNDAAEAKYNSTKEQLMAIINTQYMAAA